MASALASQSDAQTTFPRTAAAPTWATSSTEGQTIDKIHRYSLDELGNLNGQITAAGDKPNNISVYVMQGNRIVQQSTTDALGEFTLPKITPGRYSIIIAGQNQLAVQGVMIDGVGSEEANNFIQLSTIRTAYQGVQDLVTAVLPKQISTNLGTTEGSTQQVSATLSDAPVANQVRIINGNIRGQIVSLTNENNIAGTTVHLLQNSKPVSQVEIDDEGMFTIPDIEAGTYDLVATAKSGMAVMRIEAVGNDNPMKMVSFGQQIPVELNVPLAEDLPLDQQQILNQPPQQVLVEPSSLSTIEYATESIGFGGANGSIGGVTGNFSSVSGNVLGPRGVAPIGTSSAAGAAGLSRLVTLGSLAATATAIAVDDDDDTAPASNASN